jgi:hypothetical protein
MKQQFSNKRYILKYEIGLKNIHMFEELMAPKWSPLKGM